MSIRVVCPNGHTLKVKNSLAGKTGLCPVCKARIQVPRLRPDDLSEDAIMDILGPRPGVKPADSSIFHEELEVGGSASSSSVTGNRGAPPKKSCHKCHQEIEAGTHICPHCHTYIAGLTDF